MAPEEVIAEITAIRLGEMRRDVDVARARAALAAVAELRIESERPLLQKLLRHSSEAIVVAAFEALTALGERIDLEHVGRSDLAVVLHAMLLVLGPTETFNRVAPLLEPDHARRAEVLEASMRALFRDFEWSNADAKLVQRRGWLRADERWLSLAREIERTKSANKDLRAVVRDMLRWRSP